MSAMKDYDNKEPIFRPLMAAMEDYDNIEPIFRPLMSAVEDYDNIEPCLRSNAERTGQTYYSSDSFLATEWNFSG